MAKAAAGDGAPGEATEVALARIEADRQKVLSRHETIRSFSGAAKVAFAALPLIPVWLTVRSIAGTTTHLTFSFGFKLTIGISVALGGALLTQLFASRRRKQKVAELQTRCDQLEKERDALQKQLDSLKALPEAGRTE